MGQPFYHDARNESLTAAMAIVPVVFELVKPRSVVDIGCGSGSFLSVFKQLGAKQVLGIDGPWARKELVSQFLGVNEFMTRNLEDSIVDAGKFDLAVNLEVAEHLSPRAADQHVRNLVGLSDVILFSAAIPYQGGQHHVNEQWPSYWAEKFRSYDYHFKDVLRPVFWGRSDVKYWYQQNIFLVVKNNIKLDYGLLAKHMDPDVIMEFVHPEIYLQKMQTIERIKSLNLKYAYSYLMRRVKERFS